MKAATIDSHGWRTTRRKDGQQEAAAAAAAEATGRRVGTQQKQRFASRGRSSTRR